LYASATERARHGERTISLDEMTGVQALERIISIFRGSLLRRQLTDHVYS
jgi:hypothetical protein